MKDHILMLDDDVLMLETVNRIFRNKFATHMASEVAQAWDILYKFPVKVLLVDYNLQDSINGIEFCVAVKEEFPMKQIVLVTGNKEQKTVIDALNSQAINSYITKPFDFDEIQDEVVTRIERYNQELSIINTTVDHIRTGQELDVESLDIFGRELHVMASLLFEGVEFTYDQNRNNIIAVLLYDQETLIFKKIIDTTFSIKNEQIFFGFVEGLNSLSSELFVTTETEIQSIELQNHLTAVISLKKEYRGIVFVTDPIINKQDLLESISTFFDYVIEEYTHIRSKHLQQSQQWRDRVDELVTNFIERG